MAEIATIVYNIFDEAQKNAAALKGCTRKLSSFLESHKGTENHDSIILTTFNCFDRVLLCAKREPAAERIVKFFCTFFSDADEEVFRAGLEYLLWRSQAPDKTARFRSLQAISNIMSSMSDDAEISRDLWDSMAAVLLPRMKDKAPNVRLWAIKAMKRLQNPMDDKDPVIKELIRCMASDSGKDIREAAVSTVYVTKLSLPHVVERMKDIRPEVRVAAYATLTKTADIRHLKPHMRAQVVQFGLRDRDEEVKSAAVKLVLKWLAGLDYSVPKLLHLFNLAEYEEEAEIVGLTIMDEIEKNSNLTNKVKKQIQDHIPQWEGGIDSLPPGEVLWAYLRCHYAKKMLSPAIAEDTIDSVIPDIVRLCELLREAHRIVPPTGYGTGPTVLSIRYLLRITGFVENSDISGSQEIEQVCKKMMKDIILNECLIDPVMSAWFRGVNAQFGEIVTSTIQEIMAPMEGDSEEDETLKTVRAMQMIAWMLNKYSNGSKGLVKDSNDFIQAMLPTIFNAIQTPIVELRELAVRCLGLSSIAVEDLCEQHQQIVLQVAQTEEEEDVVRGQALQALFDIAIVHAEKYHNDNILTNVLLRQLESGNTYLMSIASEGCAKLLFTGVLTEPRLFAQLLKLFLIMEQPLNADPDEDDVEAFTSLGSSTHMQQVLSVFFHAFFVAGEGREVIALQSIGDLISDISSMIRYEDIDGTVLCKVVSQFMSLCDSAPAGTIQKAVRQSLFACITREILKSSPGKSDRNAIKDFVKALSMLPPKQWIEKASLIPSVDNVIGLMFKMTQDKPSLKILEKFSEEAQSMYKKEVEKLDDEEIEEASIAFMMVAPGLAELVEMAADTPADIVSNAPSASENAVKPVSGMFRPKLLPKTPAKTKKAAYSDDEDDNVDDDTNGINDENMMQSNEQPMKAAGRPKRGAKAAATDIISDQMKESIVC